MEKEYTLKLTEEEIDFLLQAMSELSYKSSANLIHKVQTQCKPQNEPETTPAEEEVLGEVEDEEISNETIL